MKISDDGIKVHLVVWGRTDQVLFSEVSGLGVQNKLKITRVCEFRPNWTKKRKTTC
jgi:hypothetical protein